MTMMITGRNLCDLLLNVVAWSFLFLRAKVMR